MIRPASRADAELLCAIHRECFSHYWNVEAFEDFFGVENSFGLVAEGVLSDGCLVLSENAAPLLSTKHPSLSTPVGMIVCRVQHEQADIMTMAVQPVFRKQGIGRALIEKALVRAAELGAGTMFLDVEDGNLAALKLYESQGFTHDRRRRQYYRQKDGSFTDALVMKRKLP